MLYDELSTLDRAELDVGPSKAFSVEVDGGLRKNENP